MWKRERDMCGIQLYHAGKCLYTQVVCKEEAARVLVTVKLTVEDSRIKCQYLACGLETNIQWRHWRNVTFTQILHLVWFWKLPKVCPFIFCYFILPPPLHLGGKYGPFYSMTFIWWAWLLLLCRLNVSSELKQHIINESTLEDSANPKNVQKLVWSSRVGWPIVYSTCTHVSYFYLYFFFLHSIKFNIRCSSTFTQLLFTWVTFT